MRTSAKILSLALVAGLIAVSSVPARAADEMGSASSTVQTATDSSAATTKAEVKKEVKHSARHHVKKHVKATHAKAAEAKSMVKEGTAYDAKTNQ